MKYFHNSWRNFLNENIRTEDAPFKDTRIRIKLENDEKLLREVTEDEFEHIQRAIDELSFITFLVTKRASLSIFQRPMRTLSLVDS